MTKNEDVPRPSPAVPYHLIKPDLVDYLRGFILAITLTAIPFSIVAFGDTGRKAALIIISVLAAVQIPVHLRFFMHYSTKRAPFEVTIALVMAVMMAAFLIAGGIWVMADLNERMMP